MLHAVLELRPNESKALFRLGQAHAELGAYDTAAEYLAKAEAAAEGDEGRLKAIKIELERLGRRDRAQKKGERQAYAKMFGADKPPPYVPPLERFKRKWEYYADYHPAASRVFLPGILTCLVMGPVRLIVGPMEPLTACAIPVAILFGTNWLLPPTDEKAYRVNEKVITRKDEDERYAKQLAYRQKERLQKAGKGWLPKEEAKVE